MKVLKKILLCFLCLVAFPSFADSALPGSFEAAGPGDLEKVLQADKKLSPAENEFVVYYFRKDKNYEPWALWLWALPGGDGNANWTYTQKWNVLDDVAYMRFALDGSSTGGNKPVSSEGTVGLIVRQKGGWTKDGNDDRVWNINTCKRCVIFSGDQNTYAALPYKPSIKSAELTDLNTIKITLSGRYALDTDGGASGFEVTDSSGKKFVVTSAKNSDSSSLSDNYTKNVTLTLKDKLSVSESLFVANKNFIGKVAVNSQKLALSLAEKSLPAETEEFGAFYKKGAVTFKIWAPTASSVTANIYKNAKSTKADFTLALKKNDATGLWSATFDKADIEGYFYDYTIVNSKGTKTVLDPYAKSMACYYGKGGAGRAAIVDMASPSSLPAGGMKEPYLSFDNKCRAVIYEVSVRDFTISDDSGVKAAKGTYTAFIEKIPYLKDLGITHVQLLPVLNFYNNDESDKKYDNRGLTNGSNYNWGYDPHNYFTPEGWYASDAEDPYCRIRELRTLIEECHKAGIGVILDVVYNHMADSALLDDIVPGYYFRMNENGGFKSASGCGNDTASEHAMMKRLIKDSTLFWVKNYKVDGFRFDLMGLMEASSVLDSYKECAKVNPSVIFEGEGWKMYDGESGTVGMDQNYMTKTDDVSVFNDEFRDLVKAGGFNETGLGLATGKAINTVRLFNNMCGRPAANYKADNPADNLNYLVCHDGLTLHDLVVNNCHLEDGRDDEEIISRIKLANFIELTSQGLVLLHAGQERGRSKPNVNSLKAECINEFVRNSYDSSDNINQIVWTLTEPYAKLLEYTKGLIDLRLNTSAFTLSDAEKIQKSVEQLCVQKGDASQLAFSVKADGGKYLVFVNASNKKFTFKTDVNMSNAKILVDKNHASSKFLSSSDGIKVSKKKISLDALTAAVLFIDR